MAVLSDGSVSATWRTEDSSVAGLEPLGIDYIFRGGLAVSGNHGTAAVYIGAERLTDSWTDFNEGPVTIGFIALELTASLHSFE